MYKIEADCRPRFVVPIKKDPELGWFFAGVIGCENGEYVLFVWDILKVIKRSIHEVKTLFTEFEEEEAARACLNLRRRATTL